MSSGIGSAGKARLRSSALLAAARSMTILSCSTRPMRGVPSISNVPSLNGSAAVASVPRWAASGEATAKIQTKTSSASRRMRVPREKNGPQAALWPGADDLSR